MIKIPTATYMDHATRVNFIFDTIADKNHDNVCCNLQKLINTCGEKEVYEFDDEIPVEDFNKIHVRKTAKFMQNLIIKSGVDRAKEVMNN